MKYARLSNRWQKNKTVNVIRQAPTLKPLLHMGCAVTVRLNK